MLQDGIADSDSMSDSGSSGIEPLPGLESILEELLQEDGYVSITEKYNYLTYSQCKIHPFSSLYGLNNSFDKMVKHY